MGEKIAQILFRPFVSRSPRRMWPTRLLTRACTRAACRIALRRPHAVWGLRGLSTSFPPPFTPGPTPLPPDDDLLSAFHLLSMVLLEASAAVDSIGPSADAAYLEHDPADRPPPSVFRARYMRLALDDAAAALRTLDESGGKEWAEELARRERAKGAGWAPSPLWEAGLRVRVAAADLALARDQLASELRRLDDAGGAAGEALDEEDIARAEAGERFSESSWRPARGLRKGGGGGGGGGGRE